MLIEIGNAMASVRLRGLAANLLERLERDPAVQVVSVKDDLYNEALQLYRSRHDKTWGLTDCISFVIMQRLGITDALTADHPFEQAGFRALMRLPG